MRRMSAAAILATTVLACNRSALRDHEAHASAVGSVPQQGPPLPRGTPTDAALFPTIIESIVPNMKMFVDSGRIAGAVTAIARYGRLVHLAAVGTMDSARSIPMRTDAVFRIYSMTKPVTTVAIMQLIEQEKVRLDDPVSKFIPAFRDQKVFFGRSAAAPLLALAEREITIEHLLTHTSGLSYGVFSNTPVDTIYRAAGIGSPARTLQEFADTLGKLPLLFQPGVRWNYSVAIDVLGRVVEVASGKAFDVYLQEAIFVPLDMRSTAFHATSTMNGRIAWMFSPGPEGRISPAAQLLSDGYRDDARLLAGGQGLLSTVPDYLRFAQMLLNGGELGGRRILRPESVASMMRNHLPENLTPIPLMDGHGFGFGGAVQVDSGPTYPAAPGTFRWGGYASTFFWIDPRNRLIGMLWTQVAPTYGAIEAEFQKAVYAAVIPPR
jgi:CubicO group peptidase (beta-lactamase class C family)